MNRMTVTMFIFYFVSLHACSDGSSELIHEQEPISEQLGFGSDGSKISSEMKKDQSPSESAEAIKELNLKRSQSEKILQSRVFSLQGSTSGESKFSLIEGAQDYLSVSGAIEIPQRLTGERTPIGCLLISVKDPDHFADRAWLRIATTGIRGDILDLVRIPLLLDLQSSTEVPLVPDSLTLEHFSANTAKNYEREVCFALEPGEIPTQQYQGDILIQYLQSTEKVPAGYDPPEEPVQPQPCRENCPPTEDHMPPVPDEETPPSDDEKNVNDEEGLSPEELAEKIKETLLPEDIKAICENLEKKVVLETLFYPEQTDCRFSDKKGEVNSFGNLHKKESHLQARESQGLSVDIPAHAVLCSLEVSSKSDANIQYDDFLILSLNSYVLMLSNEALLREMPIKNSFYSWDFEKIRGKYYEFDGGRYCLSNSQSCAFPGHDVPGPVNFFLDTQALAPLSCQLEKESKLIFTLTATGDNDKEDCWHTDLNLSVKATYVDLRAIVAGIQKK